MAKKWRAAKSIEVLREQINCVAPRRSRRHDGTIGDAAHAGRKSDHNPHIQDGDYGVVSAIDFTDDPAGGLSCELLAERLRASRDPRIKYVIWNGQIFSSLRQPWQWRPYKGSNMHRTHLHLSVMADKALYDFLEPWRLL